MPTVRDCLGGTSRLLFMFIDVVAYSREPDSRQLTIIKNLQEFIRRSALLELMEPKPPWAHTIMLPTGDGVAFCFSHPSLFEHPELLLQFASDLRTQCDAHRISLRIGLHAEDGQIYEDINGTTNVAGNGINIAQRVMSQADGGQILASRAYYSILSSKLGENEASRYLDELGLVQVKHGVMLDLYVYKDPKRACSTTREPVKLHQRRLVVRGIQSNLRRIEEVWHEQMVNLAPEKRGADGPPELRVTLLYSAPHPVDQATKVLRVSAYRYMRDVPWSAESPPKVYFDVNQGPSRALRTPPRPGDKLSATALIPITGLPDTKGSRSDQDPNFEAYGEALRAKCGTPRDTTKMLRRHARSYFYIPFGLGDERDEWDGVISIDSVLPFVEEPLWANAVREIRAEWEAIGCLWKLYNRI